MKNRLTQFGILGLLVTTIVTAESCRKEDPPAETITTSNTSSTSGNTSGNNNGGNNGGNTINGCTDIDSPLYNSSANTDDGSCQYAYTASYEMVSYPLDDNGSAWDPFGGNPDLLLKIKEQGTSNWMFESDELTNHDGTSAATWTAPSAVKLLNKTYEWELVDYDPTSANDPMASGTFNPISLASNGSIITTAGGSQLKITYTLQ